MVSILSILADMMVMNCFVVLPTEKKSRDNIASYNHSNRMLALANKRAGDALLPPLSHVFITFTTLQITQTYSSLLCSNR